MFQMNLNNDVSSLENVSPVNDKEQDGNDNKILLKEGNEVENPEPNIKSNPQVLNQMLNQR